MKYFLHPEIYGAKDEDGEFEFDNLAPQVLLKDTIKKQQPDLKESEIQKLVENQTKELEEKTPSLHTWQDFDWPVLDGDYAQFIAMAGQGELNKLAPDGDGYAFFEKYLIDNQEIKIEEKQNFISRLMRKSNVKKTKLSENLWKALKPGFIREGNTLDQNWQALALVFKSTSSDTYAIAFNAL